MTHEDILYKIPISAVDTVLKCLCDKCLDACCEGRCPFQLCTLQGREIVCKKAEHFRSLIKSSPCFVCLVSMLIASFWKTDAVMAMDPESWMIMFQS